MLVVLSVAILVICLTMVAILVICLTMVAVLIDVGLLCISQRLFDCILWYVQVDLFCYFLKV